MPLSKSEIGELVRLVYLTRDDEINCEQCLSQVGGNAELRMAGNSVPAELEAVEHHLSVCAECREEFETLLRAFEETDR